MADVESGFLAELKTLAPKATNDSFLQELKGLAPAPDPSLPSTARSSGVNPAPILPASSKALSDIEDYSQSADFPTLRDLESRQQTEVDENQVSGVPLDVKSGANALLRLRLGAEQNKQKQLEMLRGMYGQDAVRMDKTGNWIFRSKDETGKAKDVLVNEVGMSARDFLDYAHEFPAAAFSFLTTKGVPAGKILSAAVRGAAGWAAGESLTDAASRAGRTEINPSEIASNRGSEAVMNSLLGYGIGKGISAMGTLGKLVKLASSEIPAIATDATKAGALAEVEKGRQAVSSATGVTLNPTVGELTGNPMIQRLEAFLSNIPLARGMILKNWQRALDNEKAIQGVLLGKSGGDFSGELPDTSDVGQKVVDILGGNLQRAEDITGKAADIVRFQGMKAAYQPLKEIPGRPLSSTSFGQRMITRGEAQLESFKGRSQEMFGNLRDIPETTSPLFDASPIKSKAEALKNALVKDSEGDVEKALAPSGISSILQSIDRQPDRQSYFDLVKLRNAIYDRVDSPEPISSTGSRVLKDLAASVTGVMQEQGPQIIGPRTWPLVQEANKFYSENVETFYQKGIHSLLKPRTEAGAIDPERIAANLVAGGSGSVTTYNTLKDFFEKSGAVKDMNRLLRDRILDSGTDQATGFIKLENLSSAISKVEPEIVKQLMGADKASFMESMRQAQAGLRYSGGGKIGKVPERGSQGAIEADLLKRFLDDGDVSPNALRSLVNGTDQLRKAYSDTITKAVARNDYGVIEAAPEKFVRDYLLNPSTPAASARNAMQQIYQTGDNQLLGDIRRVYLADLFNAGAKEGKGEVGQIVSRASGSPLRDLDPQKFAVALQDDSVRKRMNLILGPEAAKTIGDFAVAIAGRSTRDLAGTTTGAFAGGKIFHELLKLNIGPSQLSELSQYYLLSHLLTDPKAFKTLRAVGQMMPENTDKVAKALVLTPEFMHSLASGATSPDEAKQVATELNNWAKK